MSIGDGNGSGSDTLSLTGAAGTAEKRQHRSR